MAQEQVGRPPIGPVLEYYGWDGQTGGYGAWQNTRCPFHGDRHASARVNLDEGAFHCNACDVSGDVYEIVRQREGVGFLEAKRRIQEITGHSGQPVSQRAGLSPARLASSKLPAWTRDRRGNNKRLSSRDGRRGHS